MHSEICDLGLFQCPYVRKRVQRHSDDLMTVVVVVKMVCDGLVDD